MSYRHNFLVKSCCRPEYFPPFSITTTVITFFVIPWSRTSFEEGVNCFFKELTALNRELKYENGILASIYSVSVDFKSF